MRLLLHTCCAPCAIYPIKQARADGCNSLTSLFYNPNIHPSGEFIRRKNQTDLLVKKQNTGAINAEYKPEEYFKGISDFFDISKRCSSCWSLRLEKTAAIAAKKGFDAFSTTLLGSPYQNHEALKEICLRFSRIFNIKFYYRDFRIGFRDAHNEARSSGMYCQNYCGCVFSLVERYERNR